MPPDWYTDIRPVVKDGVQTVIERHSDADIDLPTQTFHNLSSGSLIDTTEEVSVAVPGDIFDDKDLFDSLYEGEFRRQHSVSMTNSRTHLAIARIQKTSTSSLLSRDCSNSSASC